MLVDASANTQMANEKVSTGLTLFSQIKDLRIEDMDLITAIGRTLYKVTFKNTFAANNFISDTRISKRKLRPFIPRTALEIYDVVRGIPTCFEEKDIKSEARSTIPICSVRRFNRKDESNSYVPTTTVKIGFAGDDIPKFIIYNYTKLYVDFYIPPLRQCDNCGRLGHTKLSCKGNRRCVMCAKGECRDPSCSSNLCILCGKSGHSAKNKEMCSHWEKEQMVNRIRTVKKLSRKEVLDQYYPRNNRFSILECENESFPVLPTQNTDVVDRDNNINRNFTRRTYSQTARRGAALSAPPPVRETFRRTTVKAPVNPVYNSPSYQKGLVSQFERLITEMIRITQRISIENNNTELFEGIQGLKNQFETIIAKRDETEITGSLNPFTQDEVLAI